MRVAVLGGGWAGMAAAVELAQAGADVSVYEAARTLGGRARRVERDGVMLDNGLHILLGAYRECLRMIARVARREDHESVGLLRLPLDLHILDKFRLRTPPLPAPLHLAAGLLWAQGLSLADRLRAARFMAALRAGNFCLDRDISVSDLLTRHRQRADVRRFLWEPLCVSALNTPPERASAQIFLNVLRDGLAGERQSSDLLLPRVDLTALFPQPAADFVAAKGGRVLLGVTAERVDQDQGSFAVHAAGTVERVDHVVCALPPFRVCEVLDRLPALKTSLAQIEALRYEPIYSVYLRYVSTTSLPQPMVGIAGACAQWLFDRGQLGGPKGLFGAVISASGSHQKLEQEELALRVHTELAAALPGLPDPNWSQVIAEKRATFSCTVNVQRPSQRTPLRGLYLAGDYTASAYPATLEAAVRSGVACARMILTAHADRVPSAGR